MNHEPSAFSSIDLAQLEHVTGGEGESAGGGGFSLANLAGLGTKIGGLFGDKGKKWGGIADSVMAAIGKGKGGMPSPGGSPGGDPGGSPTDGADSMTG